LAIDKALLAARQAVSAELSSFTSGILGAEDIWWCDPLPLAEFVVSPLHMGQRPLSARQLSDIEEFMGHDPKLIFTTPETAYRVAVLVWGKGGGKDFVASLLQAWIVHILLCMNHPSSVLGVYDDFLDIVNVAYSASQAKDVYFAKFLNRIKNWEWLRRYWPIMDSGSKHSTPKVDNARDGRVLLVKDGVLFPNMIRASSEHSENESYEGRNVLFWVMDEASAFRNRGMKANGDRVYRTLRTSAHSRFPRVWRGVIMSYPRSENDFTMHQYEVAGKEPRLFFRSKAYKWEVNPTKTAEDFTEEFRLDPEDSRMKYMCQPPKVEGAFFSQEEVESTLVERPVLVRTAETTLPVKTIDPRTGAITTQEFIGKVIEGFGCLPDDMRVKIQKRVIHVDCGLTRDSAGMVIAHGEPMVLKIGDGREHVFNRVVVDAALRWVPDKGRGLKVSINNIASIILEIHRQLPISYVTYDHWNSQSSIESLMSSGISVEAHNINTADWYMLRSLIHIGGVTIPKNDSDEWEQLRDELFGLVRIGDGPRVRIDHPDDGSKDIADCLAGCARNLNLPEIRERVVSAMPPSIIMSAGPGAMAGLAPQGMFCGPAGSGANPIGSPVLGHEGGVVSEGIGGVSLMEHGSDETRHELASELLVRLLPDDPDSPLALTGFKEPKPGERPRMVRPPSIQRL
jgi:hypothetical protein